MFCAYDLDVTQSVTASTSYELGGPRKARRRWFYLLFSLLDATSGTYSYSGAPVTHDVVRRRDGRIVYSVTTDTPLGHREARASIEKDLASLTIDEFNNQYGIEADPYASADPRP